MYQKPRKAEELHELLREQFVELWSALHPPLRNLYAIDSLPQFEATLLSMFERKEDIKDPMKATGLLYFAYYLGETLVQSNPNAEWFYPKEERVESAQVAFTLPNGEKAYVIPYNTVYKLITGNARNLMAIIDSYHLIMNNKKFVANVEKGKEVQLPNGAYIRTHATKDAM